MALIELNISIPHQIIIGIIIGASIDILFYLYIRYQIRLWKKER